MWILGDLLNADLQFSRLQTSIKMKTYYVVKITFDVNDVYFDAILGLNAEDALRRAEWNWDGRVEIISE